MAFDFWTEVLEGGTAVRRQIQAAGITDAVINAMNIEELRRLVKSWMAQADEIDIKAGTLSGEIRSLQSQAIVLGVSGFSLGLASLIGDKTIRGILVTLGIITWVLGIIPSVFDLIQGVKGGWKRLISKNGTP